jgi:hypothetical protein
MLRWLFRVGLVMVGLLVAIQFVPYGRDHANPAVIQDAPWPNARAAEIARVSCYNCHSNETDWPLYSNVAPMSWLVQRDVDNGRKELNFSDWEEARDELDDAIETIEDGSMPPSQYTVVHGDARLTNAEQRTLIQALLLMDEDD